MHRLDTVTLRLREGMLAFEQANRKAIDAHWDAIHAGNPRLWNGPMFMFETVRLDGTGLTGTACRTDFATFLYWRDHGRPDGVTHITGTSLPVMADGGLLAIRMAAHTANGGAVYFPAGSLEEADLVDGAFDVTASIARELREETGFDFEISGAEAVFTVAADRGAFHIARRNRLPADYETCLRRLHRHKAETGDDEIETVIAVRAGGEGLTVLRPYARALADWHFENTAFSCSG